MADYEQVPSDVAYPPRELVLEPQIRLHGTVDETMLDALLSGIADAEGKDGPLALEMCTLGGDAEMGRRMVLELELARERLPGRRLVFIGKTVVYSAGVTVMSAFPREDRFLTNDAILLIHGRQLEKTIELTGPMRGSLPLVEALCRQLKLGCDMEVDGFERLTAGSDISIDEALERGLHNWYLPARDALERKLIAGIVEGG